jgi:hypothetical protein
MARELGCEMALAMALAMASRLEASRSGSCMVVPPAKEASGKLKTARNAIPSPRPVMFITRRPLHWPAAWLFTLHSAPASFAQCPYQRGLALLSVWFPITPQRQPRRSCTHQDRLISTEH